MMKSETTAIIALESNIVGGGQKKYMQTTQTEQGVSVDFKTEFKYGRMELCDFLTGLEDAVNISLPLLGFVKMLESWSIRFKSHAA